MLRLLNIRDFVIVDCLELEFSAGFGVLTGETGAGKSILLDALGLILDGRAEPALVRNGCSRTELSAQFGLEDNAAARQWCAAQEMELEDEAVLIRRVVEATGRSRAWINGVSVTLAQLRELGELLADIHGQHAHHALLQSAAQRALLDAHAGAETLAADVAACFRQWQDARAARERAETQAAELDSRRELLQWQIRELETLALGEEEWPQLEAEHSRLAHAAGLLEGVGALLAQLAEEDSAAAAQLHGGASRLRQLAQLDATLNEAADLLDSAGIALDEALHALRHYHGRLELDPQRPDEVDRRMGLVMDAARKYRCTPPELPARLSAWQAELAKLDEAADLAALSEREAQARAAWAERAEELTARRQAAAQALSAAVTEALQTLALTGSRFAVQLVPNEPAAHGQESVLFQVAANAGQELRPLAKVASGGELSRIGLAIQVLTSRSGGVPTLIFDEVDAGIGGRVAEIVGQHLAALGRERQVICVTHLPQVAARAQWQYHIAKEEENGQTRSRVQRLDDTGRVEEIARMLGGVRITETTRQHAAEMLAGGETAAQTR